MNTMNTNTRPQVHFLAHGGPCEAQHVQVWSVGDTLNAYVTELRASGTPLSVMGVDWNSKTFNGRPGAPDPGTAPLREPQSQARYVRLFVYGAAKARRRAQTLVGNWDPAFDWFAA